MKPLQKKLVGKSLLNVIDEYRQIHTKGNLDFNNRWYDPFHIFSFDYNINEIKKITNDVKEKFFIKPECYICSGDCGPRPMNCFGTEQCNFIKHKRGNKNNPELAPVMELKHGKNKPESIYLSRPNLVWLLDHPEFEFIVRTTYSNNWVLHHSTLDRYNDSPGTIKIVFSDWHLNVHRVLKNRNQKIECLESKLLIDPSNHILKRELDFERKMREMVLSRLTLVQDDPDILRILLEIQERIRFNAV
jgi:hypothetical protein